MWLILIFVIKWLCYDVSSYDIWGCSFTPDISWKHVFYSLHTFPQPLNCHGEFSVWPLTWWGQTTKKQNTEATFWQETTSLIGLKSMTSWLTDKHLMTHVGCRLDVYIHCVSSSSSSVSSPPQIHADRWLVGSGGGGEALWVKLLSE